MFKRIVEGLALVFAAVMLVFTGWRTYHLPQLTSPGEVILPALGLVVFDVGFVVWTLVFMHVAQGIPQRAVALSGAVADLLLVIAAVVADLFLHGQTLANVPDWMGLAALITVSIAVSVNVTLVFLFHLTAPAILDGLRQRARDDAVADAMRREEDATVDLALNKLKGKRQEIADTVADGKADEMLASLLERMQATQYARRPALPKPARNGQTPEAMYAAEADGPKGTAG